MADNRNTSDRFLEELARILAEFDKKVDKLDKVLSDLDEDLTTNRYNSDYLIKSVIKSADKADKYKSLTEKTIKDMAKAQINIGKDWQYRFIHAIESYFKTIGVVNPNLSSEKIIKLKGAGPKTYNNPTYDMLKKISYAQNTGSITANFTKQFLPFIKEMHRINSQQLSLLNSLNRNSTLEILYRSNKSRGGKQLPSNLIPTGVPVGHPYSRKQLPATKSPFDVLDMTKTSSNKFEYAPDIFKQGQLYDQQAFFSYMYGSFMQYAQNTKRNKPIDAEWEWYNEPVAGLISNRGDTSNNREKKLDKSLDKFLKKLFKGLKTLPMFQTIGKATTDLLRLSLLMYASDKKHNVLLRKLAAVGVAFKIPESVGDISKFAFGSLVGNILNSILTVWLLKTKPGQIAKIATTAFAKGRFARGLNYSGKFFGTLFENLFKGILGTTGLAKISGLKNIGFLSKLKLGFNLGKLATPLGWASLITDTLGNWGVDRLKMSGAGFGWKKAGIIGTRVAQGTLTGATAGSLFMNPWTTAGGAVIGGIYGLIKGIREDVSVITEMKGKEVSWWDKLTGESGLPSSGGVSVPQALTTPNLAKSMLEMGLGHNAAMAYAANSPYYSRLETVGKIHASSNQFISDIPYLQSDFKNALYGSLTDYSKNALAEGQYIDITGATTTTGNGTVGKSHVSKEHEMGLAADVIVRNKDGSTNVAQTQALMNYLKSTGMYKDSYVHDVGSGQHGHVAYNASAKKATEVDDGSNVADMYMNTMFSPTLRMIYGI